MTIMSTLPPHTNRDSSGGTGEMDVTLQNQQQLLTVNENMLKHDRDKEYNTQPQIQPKLQNVGSEVEYLPPVAHSSVVGVKPPRPAYIPAGYINLPKEESNFNLSGNPAYQFVLGFIPHDSKKIQGNVKISQSGRHSIVETSLPNTKIDKNEGQTAVKPIDLSLSQSSVSKTHHPPASIYNNLQIKTSPFENKTALPLPHPQYEEHNFPSSSKMHSVHSVAGQPNRQYVLPLNQRYAILIASLETSKIAPHFSYSSSFIPHAPSLHYAPMVNTPPKPKVNSPMPPTNQQTLVHGKPTSGITAETPLLVTQVNSSLPTKASLTSSLSLSIPPTIYSYPGPNNTVILAVVPQPLQLSVLTATNKEQGTLPSPKRKVDGIKELNLKIKKLTTEEPLLSHVSETNRLLTSATVTTVLNTAITEGLDKQKGENKPETSTPPVCHSPNTQTKPRGINDNNKSNSHGPPPCPSRNALYKLKKAWLQRYSNGDGIDDKDVVTSGSCMKLPLILPTDSVKKQHLSAVNVSFVHNRVPMTVDSKHKSKINGNRKSHKNPSNSSKLHDVDNSLSFVHDRKTSPRKGKRTKDNRSIVSYQDKRQKLSAISSDNDKVIFGEKQSASHENVLVAGEIPKTTHPALPENKRGKQPCLIEPRDEPSTPPQQSNSFSKPSMWQLITSGESFLQDGSCSEVAPKLAKCIECGWMPDQRSRNMPNNICRFDEFRRLRYTMYGQLLMAGFSDPHRDSSEDDSKFWLPMPENPPADLNLGIALFILREVGYQFCDLLEQEKEIISIHMSDDKTSKTIGWKSVIQGVRETCDVCATTLFNFQWVCRKCGFVVCIDCYKDRKNDTKCDPGRERDYLSWLPCTNKQPHKQEKLMLTQFIPADSLLTLDRIVHEARVTWGTPMHCDDPLDRQLKPTSGTRKESGCDNDSDGDTDGNYPTLKKIFLRRYNKSNRSCITSSGNIPNESNGGDVRAAAEASSTKKSHPDTFDKVISSIVESTIKKMISEVDGNTLKLRNFFRAYDWAQKRKDSLPSRTMTLTESIMLYPNVPHSWFCNGKVLLLTDPNNPENYRIFYDQWKTGQPVIVSDVTKHLNVDLWHPDSFARDFGETKNDLINCVTENLVLNQPLRRFWEGFHKLSNRLKDERGNYMLLKLKDWPPGEDFAKVSPSRFNDLMKVFPLGEYTQRSGRLNLVSRLPDYFLRPDLGPKIYAAYATTLYGTKGTTNLHLDICDTVNLMVYVGIPKENDQHIKEVFHAIDEAGCDSLTRRRVCMKGELPGALWHIYTARDAEKIRDFLTKVALERGVRLEPHQDPIHDQMWYLDGPLRERLYKEYEVESCAIVQCFGDAVFIPAGAPYQVRNLHNCIQVAQDFVSPENISHCFNLTQEIRHLSDAHSYQEDKLQIKNILYHAVKDMLSILGAANKNITFSGIKQTNNVN